MAVYVKVVVGAIAQPTRAKDDDSDSDASSHTDGEDDELDMPEPEILFEVHSSCGAANPYLVMAGVVAAGMDGLRNETQPTSPSSSQPLPRSLDEALKALRADEAVCAALGDKFVRWFCEVKQAEVDCVGANDDEEAALGEQRRLYTSFM
eukprot:scaffold139841_cov25-Prasinocladus_malaysianus.AAC.1